MAKNFKYWRISVALSGVIFARSGMFWGVDNGFSN